LGKLEVIKKQVDVLIKEFNGMKKLFEDSWNKLKELLQWKQDLDRNYSDLFAISKIQKSTMMDSLKAQLHNLKQMVEDAERP